MRLKSAATLKALREQHGKSLDDVGRYAKRDRSYIWQLENPSAKNGRRTCKPEVAELIAELLGVPVELLFEPRKSPVEGQNVAQRGKAAA